MEHSHLSARFFAVRVGTLTNSKRIIVITNKKPCRFLSYDESDQVKENHPVADISSITLNPAREQEFTINWEGGTKEMYLCEQKESFLSLLWWQFEEERGLFLNEKTLRYSAIERTRSKDSRPTTLIVGMTSINKLDNKDPNIIRSKKWISDIQRIIKFEKNEDRRVELQFRDGTFNDYILSEKERPDFLTQLRKSLHSAFSREIVVEEIPYEKVMRERSEREATAHISPNIILEAVVNQVPNRKEAQLKPRVLSLTHSHVLISYYDPENHININYNKATATIKGKQIFSFKSIESVVRLRMNYTKEPNKLRFMIDFSNGKSVEFESNMRETIMSTIIEIGRWKSHPISVLFTSYVNGYKIGPLSNQEFKMENINYFLRRINALTEKSDENDILFILNEFNHNIPLVEPQIKDRKLIHNLFGLLKWKMAHKECTQENRQKAVVSILNCIQRCIAFKGSADEVYREKEKLPLLVALLKSSDHSLAVAVASVLQSIILTTSPQNIKSEMWTKDFLFTDENIAGFLALLLRHVEERVHALLISTLISIFESAIVAPSTSKELQKKLITRFLVHMDMLFGLCRYQCIPIVKSASAILVVLMNSIKSDEVLLKKNQDLARSSMALMWQVTLVFDSLAKEQQSLSRTLIELMVETNRESTQLFERLFPPDTIKLLFPPPPPVIKGQKPPKMLPVIIGGEGNPINTDKWDNFFKSLSRDVETPDLIWNENLRQELIFCITEEIEAYDKERETGPRNRKYAWNYQEFSVPYNCLATEMKVGPYYINLIVQNLPDVRITIRNPLDFTQRLFYRFLIETVTEHKVICLKALTWLYSLYHRPIGTVNFIENMLFILQSKPNREIVGNLLLFLREAINYNEENLRNFISMNGAVTMMKMLPLVHLKRGTTFVMSVPPVHPHTIGVMSLQLLLEVSKTQSNMDELGNFKSPIALLKRQLSTEPYLQHLVQVFCTGYHSVKPSNSMVLLSQLTIQLLEYLVQFNDAVGYSIYRTGLFYFLIRFQHINPLQIAKFIAKLHRSQTTSPGVSILRRMIPGWLVDLLERETVEMFVESFNGTKETKELYWNQQTRDYLNEKIDKHLESFNEKLVATSGKAMYEYSEMEQVEYPDSNYFETVAEEQRLALRASASPHLLINKEKPSKKESDQSASTTTTALASTETKAEESTEKTTVAEETSTVTPASPPQSTETPQEATTVTETKTEEPQAAPVPALAPAPVVEAASPVAVSPPVATSPVITQELPKPQVVTPVASPPPSVVESASPSLSSPLNSPHSSQAKRRVKKVVEEVEEDEEFDESEEEEAPRVKSVKKKGNNNGVKSPSVNRVKANYPKSESDRSDIDREIERDRRYQQQRKVPSTRAFHRNQSESEEEEEEEDQDQYDRRPVKSPTSKRSQREGGQRRENEPRRRNEDDFNADFDFNSEDSRGYEDENRKRGVVTRREGDRREYERDPRADFSGGRRAPSKNREEDSFYYSSGTETFKAKRQAESEMSNKKKNSQVRSNVIHEEEEEDDDEYDEQSLA
eukprot:TRINITY_DN85_c1_g1_i4.p1 TRINITY_DN85_c1_g1~~TRINITY_DN85_c1_g1_i4.p1  ORF type:complete len:1527 (+),score=690.08 TRINITY_DN85_c1_g1_i4:91-4671(+)